MDAPVELGAGIFLFRNCFTPNDDVLQFLDSISNYELENNYTKQFDKDGNVECLINKSGHRFIPTDIYKTCIRLSNYYSYPDSGNTVEFLNRCDDAVYLSLLQYIEHFPMLLPCLWWKTKGHPLVYYPGGEQGLHCDNDINYKPSFEPSMQLGMRHVVAAMCYLNDSFDGGEISFPYVDITHSPRSGDILIFSANYLHAHYVSPVKNGKRFAYLQYFGQGSSSPEHGVSVCEDSRDIHSGQVWVHDLFDDYKNHIVNKYGHDTGGEFLLPLQRTFHSSGI